MPTSQPTMPAITVHPAKMNQSTGFGTQPGLFGCSMTYTSDVSLCLLDPEVLDHVRDLRERQAEVIVQRCTGDVLPAAVRPRYFYRPVDVQVIPVRVLLKDLLEVLVALDADVVIDLNTDALTKVTGYERVSVVLHFARVSSLH